MCEHCFVLFWSWWEGFGFLLNSVFLFKRTPRLESITYLRFSGSAVTVPSLLRVWNDLPAGSSRYLISYYFLRPGLKLAELQ